MSHKSCCVLGCGVRAGKDVPLHCFPNPDTDTERFRSWVMNIQGDILGLDNNFIFRNRRVCRKHFEPALLFRNNKISKLSVPTLHIPAACTFLFSILIFFWLGALLALGALTVGVAGMFYSAQDLLLYYPNDPPDSREFVVQPSSYKLPYENIKIRNKDGLLIHMFLIKQTNNCNLAPTILFFHGNAGNMGQRLSNVSGLYHKLNMNILMLEYRGYGQSEGKPSERGLYIDAQSALEYLLHRSDIDPTKVILFGRSLGGAVAIELASSQEYRNKIWALIIENTFTSIPDMAQLILKCRCLNWTIVHKNKYLSIQKMCNILMPTLIICGSNDTLVPPEMGKALFIKCNARCKKLLIVPNGGHNNTWTCEDYYSSIQQFLLELLPLPSSEKNIYFDEDIPSINKDNRVHIV